MINGESGSLLKSARIKVISIGSILGLVFILLSSYLAFQYMDETKQQRLGSLKQTVQIARNSIEPILAEYRSRKISGAEALTQIRDLVRRMVYEDHDGKNYVFMSAYDGTMLVQPFEPQKEMTPMWNLKDSRGIYIIRELVKAAQSEKGQGFVSYHYQRPGHPAPEEKISFVIGIPELDCYIGTGQYMSDLRRNQLMYIAKTAGSVIVLLLLLLFQIRSAMKEIQRQNRMLQKENESLKLAEEEKEKLAERLQQSHKMEAIGTLAGGIAHDFNNILSPILGYTEMLLAEIRESEPRLEHRLTKIHTSALRARDLVNQILTFSRQEKSEARLLNLQSAVRETLRLIRSTLPTTIDIQKDIQEDCHPVKADPTQIHQIVMNLATNAYHAMETDGGVIKISLREVEINKENPQCPEIRPGTYARLTISDQGVGMEPDLIKKIFDPFFTTKELGKGTGMGLSVVHGIVKNLKGEIQVRSEPGKGTEFSIYLPVEKLSFTEQGQKIPETVSGKGESILLVDDEEYVMEMERQVLEGLDYRVTSCLSSLDAMEVFRADPGRFDLVITDMAMPKLPGDKLAAELLKIRPDIPILLYTGYSETMSEEKAAALGIRGFLHKPVPMLDLSLKIRQMLDKR